MLRFFKIYYEKVHDSVPWFYWEKKFVSQDSNLLVLPLSFIPHRSISWATITKFGYTAAHLKQTRWLKIMIFFLISYENIHNSFAMFFNSEMFANFYKLYVLKNKKKFYNHFAKQLK